MHVAHEPRAQGHEATLGVVAVVADHAGLHADRVGAVVAERDAVGVDRLEHELPVAVDAGLVAEGDAGHDVAGGVVGQEGGLGLRVAVVDPEQEARRLEHRRGGARRAEAGEGEGVVAVEGGDDREGRGEGQRRACGDAGGGVPHPGVHASQVGVVVAVHPVDLDVVGDDDVGARAHEGHVADRDLVPEGVPRLEAGVVAAGAGLDRGDPHRAGGARGARRPRRARGAGCTWRAGGARRACRAGGAGRTRGPLRARAARARCEADSGRNEHRHCRQTGRAHVCRLLRELD